MIVAFDITVPCKPRGSVTHFFSAVGSTTHFKGNRHDQIGLSLSIKDGVEAHRHPSNSSDGLNRNNEKYKSNTFTDDQVMFELFSTCYSEIGYTGLNRECRERAERDFTRKVADKEENMRVGLGLATNKINRKLHGPNEIRLMVKHTSAAKVHQV